MEIEPKIPSEYRPEPHRCCRGQSAEGRGTELNTSSRGTLVDDCREMLSVARVVGVKVRWSYEQQVPIVVVVVGGLGGPMPKYP